MQRLLTRAWVVTSAALAAAVAPALAATPSVAPVAGAAATSPGTPTPGASGSPAPSPAPALGGISMRPVGPDGAPLPEPYFDVQQDAPSSFTARVVVTNETDRAVPVHVAAVDTTTSDNGGTAFLATRAPRSGAGTWISPGRQRLTLGANSSTRLEFRVRVPRNARPGDHIAGIVVEPDRKVRVSADIERVVRVGLAVRMRVPGDARYSLDVRDLRFSRDADDARPTVTVQLVNQGERLCRPYLTATFSTSAGIVTSERRHVDTLLPRTTADYALRWSRRIPDGQYDVRVRTESCGAPSAVSESVRLDTAGDVIVAEATPSRPGRSGGLSTGAQLAALAALLLLAAGIGWRLAGRRPGRRRRRARR